MKTQLKITIVLLSVAFVAVALLAFTVAALMWHLRLRGSVMLEYGQGVRFIASEGDEYRIASWGSERCDESEPCPFVVQFPGQDLDAKHLGDRQRLSTEGWTEFATSDDVRELYMQDRLVRCWFQRDRLMGVEVNVVAVTGRKIPPVAITVFGKTVSLPASEATIIQILGPAKRKKTT